MCLWKGQAHYATSSFKQLFGSGDLRVGAGRGPLSGAPERGRVHLQALRLDVCLRPFEWNPLAIGEVELSRLAASTLGDSWQRDVYLGYRGFGVSSRFGSSSEKILFFNLNSKPPKKFGLWKGSRSKQLSFFVLSMYFRCHGIHFHVQPVLCGNGFYRFKGSYKLSSNPGSLILI